jgi:hypothetical protein
VDGSVADVSEDLPCPDAMSRISMATGLTIHGQLGDAVPRVRSGCLWSTSPDPRNPSGSSNDRLDALLRAEPRTTAEDVVSRLTADVEDRDCRWTGELDSGSFAGLQECAGATQDTWTLTVVDTDGTGAWQLSMAVGNEMPERFGVVSGTLAGLLTAVHEVRAVGDVDGEPADDPISPLNRSFNDVVNGFDARSRAVRLSAPSTPMSCPELPAGLADRTNGEPPEVRGPRGSLTCTWSGDAGPSAGLSYSVGFVAGEARVFHSERDVDLDFADGGGDIGACFGVVLPGTDPAGGLAACQLTDREEWRLDLADAGGEGTWVVTLDLPVNAGIDSAETVRALIDLADARW